MSLTIKAEHEINNIGKSDKILCYISYYYEYYTCRMHKVQSTKGFFSLNNIYFNRFMLFDELSYELPEENFGCKFTPALKFCTEWYTHMKQL